MKVVSWNVNGLRATLRSGNNQSLKGLLDSLEADIICFQETKATREQLDETLYIVDGYNAYFSFCRIKKGYSGVVTFCRDHVTPIAAEEGLTRINSTQKDGIIQCYGDESQFTDEELSVLDCEGRAVLTEHCLEGEAAPAGEGEEKEARNVVIVNVYCPMYDTDRDKDGQALNRLQYKLNFYKLLESRCSALERAGKLVIAVGDFNCSREELDSAYMLDDPSANKCRHSKEWISNFTVSQVPKPPPTPSSSSSFSSTKLLDTFRYLHPDRAGAYTCWCTRLDYRKTNFGTRIDYILTSCCLAEKVIGADVWQHIQGSDHCPVVAEIDVKLCSSDKPPPLSSSWFTAKQSKLSDFLVQQKPGDAAKRGVAAPRGVKRPANRTTAPPPKQKTLGQRSLFSFSTSASKPPSSSATPTEAAPPAPNSERPEGSGGKLSGAWKDVFSGPKAPLCSGHNEACVLRKVKKQGPNKDRQFWVCARPGGSKEDPQARCDFFKWTKDKKK